MRTEVVARRPGRERAQRETEPFSVGSRAQSATVDRPASVWPESCLGGRAVADRIHDLLTREDRVRAIFAEDAPADRIFPSRSTLVERR